MGSGSSTYIHILDNDSLLNIFHLCRPFPSPSDENEEDAVKLLGGGNWNHERWWYSLAQVCRRWRHLVLESASFLDLSLLCTYGTPVVDLLAHLPPLPLIIDYHDKFDGLTADDELGITLALWQCDRVRCIRLMLPYQVLWVPLEILQGEFPNLEYLIIERYPSEHSEILYFPKTFRAPRLRYLVVMGLDISTEPPSLTTIGNPGPVALSFKFDRCGYFHPKVLLQQLSVVPQRETHGDTFNTYLPSHEVDRKSLQRAIMRRVTPYIRCVGLQSANAYLETLLPRVTIRLLERLQLYFFDELTYLIPCRQKFTNPVEIPRFEALTLNFSKDYLRVFAYFPRITPLDSITYTLCMDLLSRRLDLQVAHAAQVFHMLRAVFSVVERLYLKNYWRTISSDRNNEAGRSQWREFLRAFGNVKTLYIEHGLIGQLSRSLQPGEGESPMDLLPELQKLFYIASVPLDDAFSPFIEARQKVGRPVTVIHILQ